MNPFMSNPAPNRSADAATAPIPGDSPRHLAELARRLSEIDSETCPVRRARLVRHLAQCGALIDALGDAIGITDRRFRIEEARAGR